MYSIERIRFLLDADILINEITDSWLIMHRIWIENVLILSFPPYGIRLLIHKGIFWLDLFALRKKVVLISD